MSWFKNTLAIIGVLSLLLFAVVITKALPYWQKMDEFHPQAKHLYSQLLDDIFQSVSAVDAMTIRIPVKKGISADEVDRSIKTISNELNIKKVGELPLYKEVEAISGAPFRYMKIYLLCDAMTAASMMNYNDAFSSFLPCRITLLKDQNGQLWMYTMNMDLMIYGGRRLPPALETEALKIRNKILQIMNRAAIGDF